MQILQGTVLFSAGKTFPSKVPNGRDRQSIKLAIGDTNEEISIWFDEGPPGYCSLKRGETVQIIKDKDKFHVPFDIPTIPQATPAALSSAPSTVTPPTLPGEPLSEDRKAALFRDICLRAKVLKSCHVQALAMFTAETGEIVVTESTIQQYAIALYNDVKSYWQ